MSSPSPFIPLDNPNTSSLQQELPDLPPGPKPSPRLATASPKPTPQPSTSSPIPILANPLGRSPSSSTGSLFSLIPPIQLGNIDPVPKSRTRAARTTAGWTGEQPAVAGPSQVLQMQYGQGMAVRPAQGAAFKLESASPQHTLTGGPYGQQTQARRQVSKAQTMPAQIFPLQQPRDTHLSQSLPDRSAPIHPLHLGSRAANDLKPMQQLPSDHSASIQRQNVRPIQRAAQTYNSTSPPSHPDHRQARGSLYQSCPSAPSVASSGAETESGVESDTTVRPRRIRTHSASQPDLVALRNRLEGWAGDVAARQAEGKKAKDTGGTAVAVQGTSWDTAISTGKASEVRRRASHGRKTPPSRQIAMSQQFDSLIATHPASQSNVKVPDPSPVRSHPFQPAGKSKFTSPKKIAGQISPRKIVSPILHASPKTSPSLLPVGGVATSEDADDDLDSPDSPSSGSLSFSSKRQDLRRRQPVKARSQTGSGGLGLDFGEATTLSGPEKLTEREQSEERVEPSNLFPLRLLAIFPAIWGCLVLVQGAIFGGLWINLYPWGVDTSRDALERVLSSTTAEGVWGTKARGDLLLAAVWSLLTGHYCFGMTTGLTHRWRVYYDLSATITRLLSIQCICWPLTGLTLWVLGPDRILFAWVVIGCTTAGSRSVQMYVTSNISLVTDQHGEITPRLKTGALPGRRRSLRHDAERMGKTDDADEEIEEELEVDWWERFRMDRKWDWDLVARKVGWKLGSMLLLTCAWLFLGIETGRYE